MLCIRHSHKQRSLGRSLIKAINAPWPTTRLYVTRLPRKAKKTPSVTTKSNSRVAALPSRPFLDDPAKIREVLHLFDGSQESSPQLRKSRLWTAPTIANKTLIDGIIDEAGLEKYQGKIVLEMNPGPGLLAERILERVKPKLYLALEGRKPFLDVLETLKSMPTKSSDTEVIVRYSDGFEWSSYSDLERDGTLNYEALKHDSSEINPNLVFIATAKSQNMEQLVAQWIDTMGTSSWLQKFGRVKMYLFVSRTIRQRLLASPGSNLRTKGTFVREGTCHVREISHSPFVLNVIHEDRVQYQQDFEDLPQSTSSILATPDHYHPMTPLSLLEITPYEKTKITAPWETFEFIVKTLLMNKSTPLHQQIRTVASGAYVILKDLAPDLRKKWPQDMTIEEMDAISVAFDAWPFKPQFLHTEVSDMTDSRSRKYGHLIKSHAAMFRPMPSEFNIPTGKAEDKVP